MAQDIRELFKNDKVSHEKMPNQHQDRFLEKLNHALPQKKKKHFTWMHIAASVVVILGLSFTAYNFFKTGNTTEISNVEVAENESETEPIKTLGDFSPGLKKVEDYYLASINLELSKIKYTPENKEMLDDYINQLQVLDLEYKRLSVDLTESGLNELTVNALIDNLKLRLNLLYRLRTQIQELNPSASTDVKQSI
ncbi:hypothetical protein [Neotamlana laminarinivorans]|uniref:Anti-sigma factor n=1 Tax=Neotamlana laminarinivorans TaxID=2883124 RepID=A0A9X1I563_9FLAO|nr:hypothetical protein [Tamlana laminarinivorans]MCB4800184.1 hypothetical protein [Tamlana laminarinivorans]